MTASTAVLAATRLLPLVDRAAFRTLFVEELGWENPDQPPRTITVEDQPYVLTQVAGYKGMRIWHCPKLPGRRIQRAIDQAIAKDNLERLVIFTGAVEQEWRWPRRAQTGGVNAKLLAHTHTVGKDDPHLVDQLEAITIDFDEDPTLVEVLARMRAAFDVEAEAASVAAARLMARLYNALDETDLEAHEATLLLARLLFLLFGDDSGMWRTNMFRDWLATHTTANTLHTDLAGLFEVLNTPEKQRVLPADAPLADFRYVNGGLYQDHLHLATLNEDFRAGLLEACDFDWSLISPAVFGSMFQVVKGKEARREGGEHYTTEENILKTINPLFLDEYRERLERAWNNKGELTKLHNELGRLRIMDPACGCGNFLIVSYRELRALELEILKRRRDLDEADANWGRSQMTLDVTGDIKVTLDHFYGIEIDEWPARIAEVAMLLVDHLMNQAMEEEFGVAPDRLPVKIAPTIVHGEFDGNALLIDWKKVLPPSDDVIIVGNPPFLGHKERTEAQGRELRLAWGTEKIAHLDYVTGWYAKAVAYFGSLNGRWAFVSTNSVVQGESVPLLFGPIFRAGWQIKFAHRTFQWSSEAEGMATVQVVIVGFSRRVTQPKLFDYIKAKGAPFEVQAERINAYLVDGPNVLVTGRQTPISDDLPEIFAGSTGIDWNHLVVTEAEVDEVRADPIASKYLRRYLGGRELIRGLNRWCLWMADNDFCEDDIHESPILAKRVAAVREKRLAAKRPATRALAQVPHLFGEIRQPTVPYLAMPQTFSEHRLYATADRLPASVVASIKLFWAPDPDGFLFAIFSSAMFITWQKTVGGRLESRPSFSSSIVWNNLPLPPLAARDREQIIEAGEQVLEVRRRNPERTLREHYDPGRMDPDLLAAHQELDELVDSAFGASRRCATELERQELLFARYKELAPISPD